MLPTIGLSKDILTKNGFINAYSHDDGKEHPYENCIYVLFKPDDIDIFRDFVSGQYTDNDNIVEDYDYDNEYLVAVYKLNEDFKKDFDLVRKGKYSKTSKYFKDLFPEKVKIVVNSYKTEQLSLQNRIFTRSKDLVEYWETKLGLVFTEDMELWEGFDIEKETLNIKKIKEYEKTK